MIFSPPHRNLTPTDFDATDWNQPIHSDDVELSARKIGRAAYFVAMCLLFAVAHVWGYVDAIRVCLS